MVKLGERAGLAVIMCSTFISARSARKTLSLSWFTPGRMYFGHIGDSRIYYLASRTGALKQLSQDDTHVGWLFRQGKISEREAREHLRRHALQKALGARLTQRLNCLSFTHKKEFIVWYSEAKKEDTRTRRVEKMNQMLAAGKVIR